LIRAKAVQALNLAKKLCKNRKSSIEKLFKALLSGILQWWAFQGKSGYMGRGGISLCLFSLSLFLPLSFTVAKMLICKGDGGENLGCICMTVTESV
jgi:hypothetical protein